MTHENCREISENEILKKAGEINLEYCCKIGELLKNLKYSECVELYKICDLAKNNNCEAHIYYSIPQLKKILLDTIQWHKFNNSVHGIELT